MTTATQQETATFYCWAGQDHKGRSMPSGQAIFISGGSKVLAKDGSTFQTPLIVGQFHNGMCVSSDPEVIEGLRKKCGAGMGITEDREEYYNHVQTAEERARRTGNINSQLQGELNKANEKLAENNRLIAKLQAQAAATPKTRAGRKPEAEENAT
jgi:hypothetical protein